jgi:hypothetical protein
MSGATKPTCGDWWGGTVMDTLLWVICPPKTRQALNIRDYGKSSNNIM